MFTEIDKVLYPNKCEVIQTTSHDFIYPIFKNGSSSLYREATEQNWKILINNQIKKCEEITVFIREPHKRFITGMNTYVENCLQKDLDKNTILFFISNYLFLDRHYMPQMFWLVNLVRYTKTDVFLNFKDISDIKNYTNFTKNVSNNHKNYIKNEIKNLEFYLEIDNFLYSHINQKISWIELIKNFKKDYNLAYKHLFQHAENLFNVLPKT